jgi:2-polyprenyl-6-methoxyphenol hydroxylase-like FAD-dependent oxidoreductase
VPCAREVHRAGAPHRRGTHHRHPRSGRVLHVLEQPARRRLRGLRPAAAGPGSDPDERRPHARRRRRETRFAGTGDLPNYFRKRYGPGWALVGDAGYHKDPLTAFGITDAFHDVELVVDALDQSLSGDRPFDDAMGEYQRRRDEAALPMFELTCQLAALEPPPPETKALFGAMLGNQAAIDDFASVMAGTLPPPAFFEPGNIGRIMEGAQPPG